MRTSPLAGPAALGALTALFASVQVTTITQRSSELQTFKNRLQELERRIPCLPVPPVAFGPPVPNYCVERRTWALTCTLHVMFLCPESARKAPARSPRVL